MLERVYTEMASVCGYLQKKELQLCQAAVSEEELVFTHYAMNSLKMTVMERKAEFSRYICTFRRLANGKLG